ncbi:MAG: hypothetical protein ACOYJD_00330 [Christensenellales bacterium]|jgi:hypothetical protein
MMCLDMYSCIRRKLLKSVGLLLTILLLVGCGANSSPVASDSSSHNPSSKVQETAAPTPSFEPTPVFEGVVGQDWHEVAIPLFEEIGGARDVAYAVGKLWAVGGRINANITPELLASSDGVDWEQIDVAALGIPADLSGEARLLAMEKEIIVIFENQQEELTRGDVPQSCPWVLRGDGENWQVIDPEQFGQWQVNTRKSGKYLHYREIVAMAERDGDIVLMPGIGWFEPYKTADYSLGLGRINSDGTAELIADYDGLRSEYSTEHVTKMLVYNGEFLVFASSAKLRNEGIGRFFNLWRSTDGREWGNDTPTLHDQKAFTEINDAVIGPKGIVAVGWEASRKPDSESWDKQMPIALFSSDGQSWEKSEFGEEHMDEFSVAATESAYYAYGEGAEVWHSLDGKSWSRLTPITLHSLNVNMEWTAKELENDSMLISKAIGFPEGLVALGGSIYRKGQTILLSGTLPFDYINQE